MVLDPFLGSGTSLIAAEQTNRSFVGYEYNEQFKSLIEHRLEKTELKNKNIDFINESKENSVISKIYRK